MASEDDACVQCELFSFFATDPKHSSLTRRHSLAGVFIPSHGKAEGIRWGALYHTS